eukprot:788347-Alexandrium_andersonii.AAC.1
MLGYGSRRNSVVQGSLGVVLRRTQASGVEASARQARSRQGPDMAAGAMPCGSLRGVAEEKACCSRPLVSANACDGAIRVALPHQRLVSGSARHVCICARLRRKRLVITSAHISGDARDGGRDQ